MFGKIKKLNECIYYIKSCAEDKLKVEELKLLINAGWEFVTSNTETYTDYLGDFPEAPKVTRTSWHLGPVDLYNELKKEF